MNKKKLIAQNEELYNMLKENEATSASLKKRVDELMIMLGAKDFEINELKTKIAELEEENTNLKSFSSNAVPTTTVDIAPEIEVNNEIKDETKEQIPETENLEILEEAQPQEEIKPEAIKEEPNIKYINAENLEDDISKYAAKAISSISLKAAMLSNTLALSQSPNSKDLLTLTLGRSEVFKQKVFEVTKSAVSFDTAKASINLLEAETIEYFEQLKAQL